MELNELTEGQIKFLADKKGISVEEYKLNSSTEGEPGKTNDLAQTANAGSETMTAGGESISADTSLEQLEIQPPKSYLIEEGGNSTRKVVAEKNRNKFLEFLESKPRGFNRLDGLADFKGESLPKEEIIEPTKEETFAIEIEENDLELEPQKANTYFNQDNNNSFVDSYYNVKDLRSIGIDINDFQGYLNRNEFSKDFVEALENKAYTSKLIGNQKGKVQNQKDLDVAKERALALHLNNYIKETNSNTNKKSFLNSYNSNPEVYADAENFEDAYGIYLKSNKSTTLYNEAAEFDYAKNNFLSLSQRSKEIEVKRKAEINKQLEQGNATGLLDAIQQSAISGVEAFPKAFTQAAIMAQDFLGMDGYATQSRAELEERGLLDVKGAGGYGYAKGKSLVIDGVKYLKNKDGLIYNVEQGTAINEVTDLLKLEEISNKIDKKGKEDYDISASGFLIQGGAVAGDVIAQMVATRGLSLIRGGISASYLAKANGFKNAKQLRNYMKAVNKRGVGVRGNRIGMNPKGIKNVETFGLKLPFDPQMLDATMFQSMYGAVNGYEGTIKAAKDAGLSNAEAHELASNAAIQMSVLYAATGPINPRLPGMNKIDNLIAKNGLFNKAIKNYRSTGDTKSFLESITQFSKSLAKEGKTVISEGAKEVVQENIQQAGETLIVNKNINEQAGEEILNQTYSTEDIINTSILSFAVGGLVGGNIPGMKASSNQKLQNLFAVGQDLKGAKARFDYLVDNGKLKREEADDILEQAKAVHNQAPKIADWVYDSEVDVAQVATILQKIQNAEDQKKRIDPSMHARYDEEIQKSRAELANLMADAELAQIAKDESEATEQIVKEAETVTKIAGEDNVTVYQTTAAMEDAGVDSSRMEDDGFMEVDGKIVINIERAAKTRAISVGSHELLHNILRSEMSKNIKAMPKIINELRDILKKKGALDVIEKNLSEGIEAGIYDIKFNEDGTVEGKNIDEYITFFSDAIAKKELPFEALEESTWRRIGRLLVNAFKTGFGNIDKEFSNGQQVFDFIRDYQKNIKQGRLSFEAKAKKKSSDTMEKAKSVLNDVRKTPGTKSSFTGGNEFKAANKTDLFSANTIAFNKAAELFGLDVKLNEDGTPAFTKAEWDGIDDNTKLGLGFVLGETWQPYVQYLMGSRRDVPGFDEYASQIVDRVSTGVEKGNDGIPFLIKTYNPEGGAKLSSYIFGQVGRRLQGAIDKQDGFGEITVDAVSDKPGAKELVQEESVSQTIDTPKYKNLVRRRIVNPVTMSNIESKIIPILRVLKTPMDAPVSNNVTSKPWVNELRLQLGKQVDLIIKQEMGGVKGGELRRFLLNNKTAILENMTTTYLTKAMPFAVQKSVAGVYTSDWQGQKIDRETTSTQKAGRTSGNELVRRLPKASLRISDAEFLAAVVGPGGNPIRGRKEALAKAIAEELSLDIIAAELKKPDSKIREVFKENQERLGVDVDETISVIADRDFERGTVKLSRKAKVTFSERGAKLTKIEAKYKKLAEKNTDGELTEDQQEQRRIDKAAVMSNVIDQLLAIKGLDEMPDLRTEQGRVEMIKRLRDMIKILPREALFGPRFGSSFTASSALLGLSKDDQIWIDWQIQIKEIGRAAVASGDFAPSLKPVNGIAIDFKTIPFSKFAKDGAASIKNNIAGIKKANRQNMAQYRALLTQLFAAVAADPQKNAGTVAAYLHLSSNHSTHIHRLAAAFVGYSADFKYGRGIGVLEHTMTSSEALSYIVNNMIEAATDKSIKKEARPEKFERMIDTVMAQYTVLALSKKSDKKLIGWLKNNMPKGWDINTGLWVARYQDAGIDLNTIVMFNGQTLGDLIKSPEGKAFIKALNNQGSKQLAEIEANPREYAEKALAAAETYVKSSRSKVVEAALDLNKEFNEMIERDKGVSATKEFSKVQAQLRGKKIGKYKFFAPGADDFRGLTSYTFAGKGKQGEADQKFIEDNLVKPYQRGINAINVAKQTIKKDFIEIVKIFNPQAKQLKKNLPNSRFTYDQALRVYLWTRQGMEVPGMDKDDTSLLNKAIADNPKLIEFANAVLLVSKQGEWMQPSEYWLTETVLSDLNNMSEKIGRKTYLAEFIAASDIVFSTENLNKIEALYGTVHRSAIEDALYSMKNGTNRPSGTSVVMNKWNNWLNQSTGAIMFFNRRSAVLQLLSTANFINWSDNNPIKAAAAFANQKQFWADFAMIFNSAKLKQRRSGLKNDVNTAELANAVEGSKNKAASALNYLLTIGFIPTQIADSFAIASGGASFYRNRVNTYLKQGKSQKEAEELAFEEFSSTADEAQQSSDPMLVSEQQRSPLGRLVLAFQNTPMQYTRLMKKAGQDLINGRGDTKTNISKIIYYGAVQNLIFSTLQSALFAFIPGFGDDDEDPEKRQSRLDSKETRVINSMIDSLLKGSGLTGAVIATVKNTIMEYIKQEEKGFMGKHAYTMIQALGISPPMSSKARKLYSAATAKNFNKDAMVRGADVIADGRLNLSPWYSIFGNLASATVNLPLDRVVDEVTSISEALDSRNTMWQRIALGMGWKTWDVGAKNEYHDLLEIEGEKQRKIDGTAKGKKTRATNKEAERLRKANMTPEEREIERKAKRDAKNK